MKVIIIAVLIVAAVLIYFLLPEIYAFRGLLAYEKQGAEEALKLYEKAYKTKRSSVKVQIRYALLNLKNGAPDKAEKLFNEIILSPKIPENKKNAAKQYRCMAYIKQGKAKEAQESAEELLEKYKTSDLYAIVGYCMILNEDERLLDFCREAYEYNSDNRDIADNYAVALTNSGDFDDAIKICDDVISENKYFPEGHYHKAAALIKKGEKEEALKELDALEDCEFKYLTTVSEEEAENLRREAERK